MDPLGDSIVKGGNERFHMQSINIHIHSYIGHYISHTHGYHVIGLCLALAPG